MAVGKDGCRARVGQEFSETVTAYREAYSQRRLVRFEVTQSQLRIRYGEPEIELGLIHYFAGLAACAQLPNSCFPPGSSRSKTKAKRLSAGLTLS